jgi:DNA-binding transcriptional regulator WhiA
MPSKIIPKIHKDEIVRLYMSGLSSTEAAARFGYAHSTCINILNERGVTYRHKTKRLYELNEEFFDCIDCESKAYWLGFITADGYISKGSVEIALSRCDEVHLNKLQHALNSNYPITRHSRDNKYHYSRVSINSVKLVSALKRLGVVSNKSTIIRPAIIPVDILQHYWRGVFDGDGCITQDVCTGKYRPQISLAGSKYITNAFRDFIVSVVDSKAKPFKHKSKNAYYMNLCGFKVVMPILQVMYHNSNIFLDRKFVKYLGVKEKYDKIYTV